MKRVLMLALVLILSVSLFGCASVSSEDQQSQGGQNVQTPKQTDEADQEAVKSLVGSFGSKLQNVSLQAPKDAVAKSMQENYSDFVSQGLLEKWANDPLNAPGRLTSSPWPDRIEVQNIEKKSDNVYEVKGEIIEITSVEKVSGGVAAKRPVTLEVKKIDSRWLIDDVTLGAYDETSSKTSSILYKNIQYGFNFSLPQSWKDYKIIVDKWEGLDFEDSKGEKVVENGPLIYIRHPQWTSQNPRQDIPIMILTLAQWDLLQNDKFHIGAAPVWPSELGRNSKYVFALPARYNFAFPTGYEEVNDILNNNSLQTVEVK
ncbi:MAG: hypothetical protein ACM3TR_12380 [Caulobacteraceae bacterium]